MKTYSEKLLSGESVNSKDWVEHLKQAHKKAPGMSPKAFSRLKSDDGKTSYQTLAENLAAFSDEPSVLDLACGDGFLYQFIQQVKPKAKVLGVDMSEGELALARERVQARLIDFKCEAAESLSAADSTYDAVLCHMALMLMTPLEPIVSELARVIKPGGIFSGVISGGKTKRGYISLAMTEVVGLIKERYPGFGKPLMGDRRTLAQEGLEEIFSGNEWGEVTLDELYIHNKVKPEEVWDFVSDSYMIGLLSSDDKQEIRKRILEKATQQATDGLIEFGFPLQIFKINRV